MINQIPGLLSDDCYIALINFASECCKSDPVSIVSSIKFLGNVFSLIGCDSNGNYFLYRSLEFILLGLNIHSHPLSQQNSTIFTAEAKDKTLTYMLMFLKSCSLIQIKNASYLLRQPEVHTSLEKILNNDEGRFYHNDVILKEVLSFCNALIIGEAAVVESAGCRSKLKKLIPRELLITLIELNFPIVNEAVVDVYLGLYEHELPYVHEEQKYTTIGSTIDTQIMEALLSSIISTLSKIFDAKPLLLSTSSLDNSTSLEKKTGNSPRTSPSKTNATDENHNCSDAHILNGNEILQCNFIYRILFKLESTLHNISDITQFIDHKIQLLSYLLPLFQNKQTPLQWNLYYINIIDIILLLIKGCDYCWEVPKVDLLDAEFLHISNQLIFQFGNEESNNSVPNQHGNVSAEGNSPGKQDKVATNKLFDTKERNSIYYLVGHDDQSTIPSVLSKSFDENSESLPPSRSATPTKFVSLSRKNTLTKEEIEKDKIQSGITDFYDRAASFQQIQKYEKFILLIKNFKTYLLTHMNLLETLIINWDLYSIEINCTKLLYFFLLSNLVGVTDCLSKIKESQYFYELLWKLINQQQQQSHQHMNATPSNKSVASSKKSGKKNNDDEDPFGLAAPPSQNLYDIKNIYGMNKKCIQLLTILVREKGSFDDALHFAEFLHLVLTTRPERLSEITVVSGRHEPPPVKKEPEITKEKEHVKDQDKIEPGTRSPLSSTADDISATDESLLFQRDNVSIFANLAFRMSSIDLLSALETSKDLNSNANNQPLIIIEDIVNMDIHYMAVSAILTLSHFDRTIRRKMVTFTSNIIESMYFINPNDPINSKPMIYLIRSMLEFVSKLELVNEETFIGLIVRCIKSPLLYIKSQICDLIYQIGQENPGLIYRGISRVEIEDEIMNIFQSSLSMNSILVLNTIKASTVLIHNINLKPLWIPVPWLYHWSKYPHNSNNLLAMITGGGGEPRHDHQHGEMSLLSNVNMANYLFGRDFISVKSLMNIVQLLKHAPRHYRLLFFTYLLSFSSSLMYACVEGVIPNIAMDPSPLVNPSASNTAANPNTPPLTPVKLPFSSAPNSENHKRTGSPSNLSQTSMLPATTPSQQIKEALVTHILPLIPIAIDFIMTLGKKNRPRKSVTSIDNPLQSLNETEVSSKGNQPDNVAGGSNVDSYSQMLNNRFYHCREKEINLLYFLNEIAIYERSFGKIPNSLSPALSTDDAKVEEKKGKTVKIIEGDDGAPYTLQKLIENIIHEKCENHLLTKDNQTNYFSNPNSMRHHSISNRSNSVVVNPTSNKLMNIFKSKPIELLTEKTIECIFSFLCTDEMFPLSTYLTHIHLFQNNPIIASIAYFMTENRNNSMILKRGLECIKYFSDNKMNLSIIAMHAPLALIFAVRHMKDVLDIQLTFVKIVFMITQVNDDFAKENLIRFNIHMILIEMIHSQHYELSPKIALQCILSLITNDQNTALITQGSGLVESICALLDSMMNKGDVKIQYYGIKIIILIDFYLPEMVSQSSKRNSFFVVMKKSRKVLIQHLKTTYHVSFPSHNIIGKGLKLMQKEKESDAAVTVTNNPAASNATTSGQNGNNNASSSGFTPLSDNIDRNDIEELLNDPIWQKEKCVIS
jgi:hypothetical protein